MALVRACSLMLPRLEAEESLLAAQRVTLAVGRRYDRADADRVIDRWQSAIAGTASSPPPRPRRGAGPFPPNLSAAGIGVHLVQKEPDGRG